MNAPKVSVIIPVYNAEKYLEKCITSVMAQTLTDLEIICVDDGSPDDSVSILKRLQEQDSRIVILSQANGGAGAARNNGLRHARGQYLSFLDADDFFEPDMLQEAVDAADRYEADFVVFNSDQYHMDTDSFVEVPWALRMEEVPPYMPFSHRQLTDNVFLTFVGWAWDKLYRRSFVEAKNLRFQEQRTTNDMLFVFSALVTAERIAAVDKVLAHQRRGSADSLSVTREKSWHCFHDALIALRQRLQEEGIYRELEKDYINYALHFSLWHLNTLAEPTHQLLRDKLAAEWFESFGITGKPASYFWSRGEYAQFEQIMGKAARGEIKQAPAVPQNALPADLLAEVRGLSGAFEMCIAFDRLRDRLMEDPQSWKTHQADYWKQKYLCCQEIFGRLTREERDILYPRICREFRRAQQLDQLHRSVFTFRQWQAVQKLISSSDGYVSMLRSLPLMKTVSRCIPSGLKEKLIGILRSGQ